jgi:translation initiation factor IF-3
MSRDEALRLARDYGLDLVEVAPKSNPPVCRILDYGKFKYQQSKRSQEARKKQTFVQIKEVKVRPKTEDHDLLMFRGREIVYPELAYRVLEKVAEGVKDLGVVESQPRQEGRFMTMMITSRS